MPKALIRKILSFVVIVAVALVLAYFKDQAPPQPARSGAVPLAQGESSVARAFADRATDVPVQGEGTVKKILPDDTEGSRHQKFILRINSGMTVMIVHNIDIAPRVAPLRAGDTVAFKGEYVWNEQGGLVHWTHHDPSGRHPGGWLRHDGQTFQ